MLSLREKVWQNPLLRRFLIDPLSHDIMRDPIVAFDGQTYDAHSFTAWTNAFSEEKCAVPSPITGEPMMFKSTIPSHDRSRRLLQRKRLVHKFLFR